jgi:purine-cytosine permease-like protein
VLVLAGALLQSALPLLGHRSIIRALRILLLLFAVLFVLLAVLVAGKLHTVPVTLLMILGGAVATVVPSASDPISGLPHAFPSWFLVPYLFGVVVQLLAVNALDLYSSGVTLLAIGVPVRRHHAVAVDAVISAAITLAVVLSGSFNTYLSDFLLFMIVWFAPWTAIYCLDHLFRGGRYATDALDGRGAQRPGGVHLPGVVAQVAGTVMALCCINTTVWFGPIAKAMGGTDLSVPAGLVVGGGGVPAAGKAPGPGRGGGRHLTARPSTGRVACTVLRCPPARS